MEIQGHYMASNGLFSFPYSDSVKERTGVSSFSIPQWQMYEHFAMKNEDDRPQFAAQLRETAAQLERVDGSCCPAEYDKHGNLLPEYDDWADLSDEEKIFQGQVNAAIAMLNRLRFDLERLPYDEENDERVTETRTKLGKLAFDWW